MKKTLTVLVVAALIGGSATASLTSTYYDMGNLSSSVLTATQSLTVASGDVVVMIGASNKKDSAAPLSSSSAAGTFVDLGANAQLGNDPSPDAFLSYLIIDTPGTYDFVTTAGAAITANVGLYQLTADSGVIELAASNAKKYQNVAVGASLSVTNFMSWSANPNFADYDGIITYGVASSLRGDIVNTNSVGGFTLDEDNVSKRLAGWSDRTGKGNVKHIWDITNANATSTESGGITAAAFAEVIPEPATLGLVSVAGLLLYFRRRRL